jgi:lipopolysaccharide biosynthesis regulator YciM
VTLYEEIAELDQDYIPEILETYLEATVKAGDPSRGRAKLDEWAENYNGISLVLKRTDYFAGEQGGDVAGRYLVEMLTAKPSVRGLDRLIDLKADGYLDAESSDDILKAVAARLMSRQPDYRCHHCGFGGHSHHWQCPSCRKWSTTKKIHGVLGE